MLPDLAGRRVFCSWSGGKDSCLALHHALQAGARLDALLTMMIEDGTRSRSHGLPRDLLEAHAQRLGVPIVFRAASWSDYEAVFIEALHELRRDGVEAGVFGDIDVEPNRAWVQRVCATAGLEPLHPLWQRDRRELLDELVGLGYEATIVVVRDGQLARSFLGRVITAATIADLQAAGVDPSGEMGEYHTVVTAGPIFSAQVPLALGRQLERGGCWVQEVLLATGAGRRAP